MVLLKLKERSKRREVSYASLKLDLISHHHSQSENSGRRKDKKLVIQHISAEEVDESEDENAPLNPKLCLIGYNHPL